jgi:glycosyltransferase involved in cell wall biosynthesis
MVLRKELGLEERCFWVGVFGYINQHKRLASVMAAVGRLLRDGYPVQLLTVGEVNDPRVNLAELADEYGLSGAMRHEGYVEPVRLRQCMKAVDVIANLRYPTMGESSGSLFHALALGKAVVASDAGAFREIPDSVAVKAGVAEREIDHIYFIFKRLLSSSRLRAALGDNARSFVAGRATLPMVAATYVNSIEKANVVALGGRALRSAR